MPQSDLIACRHDENGRKQQKNSQWDKHYPALSFEVTCALVGEYHEANYRHGQNDRQHAQQCQCVVGEQQTQNLQIFLDANGERNVTIFLEL